MWGTWDRAPDSFLLRVLFLFLRGMCPCGPIPPPPLEWISSPPLVAAVLITTKGDEDGRDESPGSSRMGVIGALVIFSI